MNRKIIEAIVKFRDERDWKQFHSGENLAKSIMIEAAELLEEFQWQSKEKDVVNLRKELADILIYCVLMAETYHLDINQIILEKLSENEKKYPIEKFRGSSKKYNEE